MMDRNTLTALLLITLVLVFTPYYMELVSPAPQPEYEDTGGLYEDTDEVVVDNSYNTLPKDNKTNKAPRSLLDLGSLAPTEDKTIVIESDLYVAKLSSAAGGSVLSYKIKKHLSPDSAYVDLVKTENRNNLLISFRGVDGEIINLQGGWV